MQFVAIDQACYWRLICRWYILKAVTASAKEHHTHLQSQWRQTNGFVMNLSPFQFQKKSLLLAESSRIKQTISARLCANIYVMIKYIDNFLLTRSQFYAYFPIRPFWSRHSCVYYILLCRLFIFFLLTIQTNRVSSINCGVRNTHLFLQAEVAIAS